jgi:hypothetical protein
LLHVDDLPEQKPELALAADADGLFHHAVRLKRAHLRAGQQSKSQHLRSRKSNQNQVGMVDGAGNVSRHGDQTALRAEDFEEICSGRRPRPAPPRTEGLGKFKRVAVPHRGFLAAPHQQFRAIGKKGFQPDEAGFQAALLRGFLQAFERDRAILLELRHRGAPQAGKVRSTA